MAESSNTRVRIGIPVPTSADAEYNQRNASEYSTAVRGAVGEPVVLSLDLPFDRFRELAITCAGFVLPGSPADVDPELYGQPRETATAEADAARERCDLLLLEHAAVSGKPVLAICYGLQRLNVWLGGTLVQDLLPLPVNHAAGASVAVAHTVQVVGQSLLASLLGAAEAPAEGPYRRLPVNSSHHQAVGIAAEGLAVVARCSQDGVVEAVEGRIGDAILMGVQWHPERSVGFSAASRSLFTWLLSEAEDRLVRRSELEGAGSRAE